MSLLLIESAFYLWLNFENYFPYNETIPNIEHNWWRTNNNVFTYSTQLFLFFAQKNWSRRFSVYILNSATEITENFLIRAIRYKQKESIPQSRIFSVPNDSHLSPTSIFIIKIMTQNLNSCDSIERTILPTTTNNITLFLLSLTRQLNSKWPHGL